MSDTAVPNDEFLADLEEAMRDVVDPELGINVVDLVLRVVETFTFDLLGQLSGVCGHCHVD